MQEMNILAKIITATENDTITWKKAYGYINGECVLKIVKIENKDEYVVHAVDNTRSFVPVGTLVGFSQYHAANIERQATRKRELALTELERRLAGIPQI